MFPPATNARTNPEVESNKWTNRFGHLKSIWASPSKQGRRIEVRPLRCPHADRRRGQRLGPVGGRCSSPRRLGHHRPNAEKVTMWVFPPPVLEGVRGSDRFGMRFGGTSRNRAFVGFGFLALNWLNQPDLWSRLLGRDNCCNDCG